MAIAHMTVKVGKVGKSASHAKYIDGTANNRSDIEKTKSGNMPEWAKNNTSKFWESADLYERSNGSTYREYEVALPRELTPEQREKLVDDFIKNEIGNKYPYQYAIHNPKAIDGQDQPHAHIMFNERKLDDVARDPEQHFKRYNAKYPDRGGAQKENFAKSGTQRVTELKELRNRWENTVNKHLELAGQTARIDMRSYEDQGLERQPERKYLPSEWHNKDKRADLIEFREFRTELEATRIPTTEIQAYLILENGKTDLDKRIKEKKNTDKAKTAEAEYIALFLEKQKAKQATAPEKSKETQQPQRKPNKDIDR